MWDSLTADKNLVEAVVPDEFVSGIRIDAFLAQKFPDYSRAFFQRCIEFGRIYLNGRIVKKSAKALPGNVVEIDWPPEDQVESVTPEDIPLDILFEDEHVIVINKPAGMVVHPAKGNHTGTLVHGLLFHNEEIFEEMLDSYKRPGIVHRLDKETSGTLIVAKNLDVWATLKETFKQHDLDKIYLAIVIGSPEKKMGTIEAPIGRHPTNRQRMAVVPEGKPSTSLYKVVAEANGCSLVKVKILTGRTHQIRVHMSHIGHPILGDPFYGGTPKNSPCPDAQRQMLHAWKLNIPHPISGEKMLFQAPIPADFIQILQKLELPSPQDT